MVCGWRFDYKQRVFTKYFGENRQPNRRETNCGGVGYGLG